MSSEQLRRSIVRAAMPLLGEHETLTMARIARAAGVSEGELLAVFADQDAVVGACLSTLAARMSVAFDPTEEVGRLAAVRVDQPIAARLVEVVGILSAYYRRVRADLEAFERSGGPDVEAGRPISGQDFRTLAEMPEVRRAVAALLRPDAQRLRLPAEALAEVFLGMSRFCTRAPNEEQPLPVEQVVNLFLHGALVADGATAGVP
jgi:AcrR family transcriptional regulator